MSFLEDAKLERFQPPWSIGLDCSFNKTEKLSNIFRMHCNQGQSEVQCSGELENTSTKWGWAEALQKRLEDCRGSLRISQQHDRTRNRIRII